MIRLTELFNHTLPSRFNLIKISITVLLLGSLTILNTADFARAMGKRPSTKEKTKEEFVLPEIEIITKPGADVEILSDDKNKTKSAVPVSPAEVIPAVGEDASIAGKKIRIADIQQALTNAGYQPGPVDGKMGPKTKKAVRDFQEANNLTVDGVVGSKTWAKLKVYLEKTNTQNND